MKDPAFLFYPADWTLGTMHMTLLEKGAYIELLMLQFTRNKFTEAHAKHMLNGSFDLVWATVSEKFQTDGEYFWNERLRLEKEKRAQFTETRRNNALKGSNKSFEKDKDMPMHMHNHMVDHMGNVNINRNILDSSIIKEPKIEKKFIPPTLQEVIDYFNEKGYSKEAATKAFNFYSAGDWSDSKGSKVKNWKQKMNGVWFTDENKMKITEDPRFQIPVRR